MVVYLNQSKFKADAFSEDSITKESVLTKIGSHDGADSAKHTEFFVNKHKLTDEVDLV